MADSRDFMLSIGAKLADGDVDKVIAKINEAFKSLQTPQIKDESITQLKRNIESGIPVIKQMSAAMKQGSEEAELFAKKDTEAANAIHKSSVEKAKAFQAEQAASEKAAQANIKAGDSISRAWRNTTNQVVSEMATMKSAIEAMESQRNDLLSRQAAGMSGNNSIRSQISAASDTNARVRSGSSESFGGPTELSQVDQAAERASAAFDRYTPALLKGVEAQRKMNLALPSGVANMKSFASEFTHMIGQFALWSAGAHLIEGGVETITKGLSDAVHSEKEQNITGQVYQAAGKDYTPAMSEQAQQSAIDMARIYGEEVIHVQESVGLWGKVTKGELLPALALTDQAMKLNAISGMNMEEIYRDATAVMAQMQEPLSRVNDLYNIATGLALRYGGGMQTLGSQSEDAVKQMMDGMTALSTIMVVGLGHGRDTLATIGAEVAITSATMNKSGEEVASHLAGAFAAIEGSPTIIKNLHAIGIETRNNANLFTDMGEQLGKVIPIITGSGGVKRGDAEYIETALKDYKAIAQAKKEGMSAMAGNAADKSFESMSKTTFQQLKELKAGWEAVGITIGREFIPDMQAAANYGNNTVVPWLLSNKNAVADLSREMVTLGLSFGAFTIAKTVIATAISAFNQFQISVSKVAVSETLSSKAMVLSLTDYQRACLATMTKTGEADADMEMAVKAFAAEHNLSIDRVILKLRELRTAAGLTASTLTLEEDGMGKASELLATRTGVAADVMTKEFGDIALAGEAMSVRLAKAFLKAIPILGEVLIGADIASAGIDLLKKHDDDEARKNPKPRIEKAQKEEYGIISNMAQVRETHRLPNGAPLSDAGVRKYLSDKEGERERIHGYIHGLQSPSPEDQARSMQSQTLASLKKQQAELDAAAKAQLAKTYAFPTTGDETYENPPAAAHKPRGIASGASQLGLSIENITTKYDGFIKTNEASMKGVNAALALQEKQIKVYGDSKEALDALIKSLQAKQNIDSQEINNYANERTSLQHRLSTAQHTVSKLDPNSQAYVSQSRLIDGLQKKLSDIESKIAAAKADINSAGGRIGDARDTEGRLGEENYKNIVKQYGTDVTSANSTLNSTRTVGSATDARSTLNAATISSLSNLENDRNAIIERGARDVNGLTVAEKSRVQQIDETITSINALNSRSTEYDAMQLKIATDTKALGDSLKYAYDTPMQNAIRAVDELTKEYNADLLIAAQNGKTDTSDIAHWASLKAQIIQATYAQAEYQKQEEQFQRGATYNMAAGAIDVIGNALSKSAYEGLNQSGNTTQADAQIAERVNQLQQEKTLLQGQVYAAQRDDIDRQIRALTEQENQNKINASKPPTFVNSVVQELEKTVIGTTLTNAETNLKKTVTEAFLGPAPKDTATKTADAMSSYKDTTVNKLVPGLQQYFSNPAEKLVAAMNSKGGVTTLATSTALGPDVNAPADPNSPTINSLGQAISGNTQAGAAGTLATNDATTQSKKLTTTISSLIKSIGSAGSIVAGMSTGGITGGMEAATGASSLLSTLLKGGAATGPIGAIASGAVGLIAALGHQDNQAAMPDKYDASNYDQFLVNTQGGSYNGATEDSSISTATGGLSQGAYIENFIKGKTQAQLTSVFGSSSAAVQSMFGDFTENGGLTNLHGGNLDVGDDKQVNWQQIQTQATDAFTAITSAANAMNQALAPIVSISAYGKGSNSSTFSPYYTPGYGDTSSLSAIPYPSLFAQKPSTATYNAPPSSGTSNITTTVNLDGQQIAQNTSQYRSQQTARGFAADS